MISPTGPKYPGLITAQAGTGGDKNHTYVSGGQWTNPANAAVDDGVSATATLAAVNISTDILQASTFGFAIPSYAVILGIVVEYKYSYAPANDSVVVKLNKGTFKTTGTTNGTYVTFGSATDLWGATWTPTDINAVGFGSNVQFTSTNSNGDNPSVDASRISVYFDAGPANVPKRYLYKLFSAGQYIGNLPAVKSLFSVSQDINTGGSQINIECGVSPDTSRQLVDNLTDEAGNILTDESTNTLTTEGATPIVAPGTFTTNALIKNGNSLQVWEYGYYYPNGKCMFRGKIERWEADFGGDGGDESIKILAYSDGQDMDNYLIRGNPYTYTLDQSQTAQTGRDSVYLNAYGQANFDGQTFTTGVSQSNIGAISVMLAGTAPVTIRIYDSPNLTNLLGTSFQNVSVGDLTEVQFAFPNPVTVTASTQYFFTVTVQAGTSIWLYYSNANPYASGAMWNISPAGGANPQWTTQAANDLYFKTFSGTGSTIGTFTSQDPTTGMLATFMNDYNARGGLVIYSASNVTSTGLSLTYTFNTNTIYEGVKAVLSLCPNGYYYYVDMGTNTIYLKATNTTADITLTKGLHLDKLTFIATIENTKNQVYFTGGATSGVNLYKQYQNTNSLNLYGPKLERRTDNRVTVTATADAIGKTAVATQQAENYGTTVTVLDRTMDTTLLKPGMSVGFNGFGTFADNVLAQVVRVDYTPEECTLTLGILPKRLHPEFEKITRGLIAQQTILNPTSPS